MTDSSSKNKKKIAIIGTGISGLTCAYLLNKEHDISVFEAGDYIGGHTATKEVDFQGQQWQIDTGFIVFNDRTYPNFEKLLKKLGVDRLATEMSFSVSNQDTGLEYSGSGLNGLFAQRSNIFNVKFLCLIKDILRFNKLCKTLWAAKQVNSEQNLGEFLTHHGFSDYFANHYILPMGAAIWSTSLTEMKAFPLYFFIRFFYNHGLLSVFNRPQWYVISGGSKQYIIPLIESFSGKIHLNSPVTAVKRLKEGVELQINNAGSQGEWQYFDEVVLACHSDQAQKMLVDITDQEKSVLGGLKYQKNEVVMHHDESLLPAQKGAWAAWNYHLNSDNLRPAALTYNMNILQNLPAHAPTFCITLNQTALIDKQKILSVYHYDHPVFNASSLASQQKRSEICGKNNTHFAGAYWYNGFHEDGVNSALDVCKRFGISL
ncbi:NAD(P)/FAD-dependent oxidoreductase [Psychromonas sp. Urea-02u-13]|uniref:NAD(P)/FAD-dependent oxidoreductase n=1 Tax=Psychromonas sp. Urea-02u-13 TaxID=2058326 RepID=UPI000C32722A|nr:FAD-dependent oxidoreductase [Psychromonas sp. Urea-02u-13]PKG38478.1 FAD-dependent oxidoreductase [Psychromonas sp. Urea-02u-13]